MGTAATGVMVIGMSVASADDGTGNEPCHVDPADLPECVVEADALLPDLMTVVPKQLQIQNSQQREFLRFSNGLANVGEGPWWLEPQFPGADATQSCQEASQLIVGPQQFANRQLLSDGSVIPAPAGTFQTRCRKGSFDFHETHNHWHIDNVGEFKVCSAAGFAAYGQDCSPAATSTGAPTVGIKFTFCLIDWYKLADNTTGSDPTRNFFDCASGQQGITPGWVDQYHQATEGQEVDITGVPAGNYVLVSTVNVGALDGNPIYEEEDVSNNTSYVRFTLSRQSNGNARLRNLVGACEDPEFLAGVEAAVDGYVQLWEAGSASYFQAMVDDMCGGHPANR